LFRLLAHPLLPSPVSKLDPTTHKKIDKERQLVDRREGWGRGVGEKLNHMTARKPAVLYE
jgi:hypothetical protein